MPRPKIKIEPSFSDRLLEIFTFVFIGIQWFFVVTKYSSMPEIIPIHYTWNGEADGWGGKWNLILTTSIGTLLSIGIYILNKYPHVFNYPVKITHENAKIQYKLAQRLMRIINLLMVLLFTHIIFEAMQINMGIEASKSWIFPLICVFLIVVLPIYFIVKMSKVA